MCHFLCKNFKNESVPLQLQKLQLEFTRILLRDKKASDLSEFCELTFLLAKIAGLYELKQCDTIDFSCLFLIIFKTIKL